MTFLSEINNRLYFFTSTGGTFKLGFFQNTNDTTTLSYYSQTFDSLKGLIQFYLFNTNLLPTLLVMPESLPFALQFNKAVKVVALKQQLRSGIVNFIYSTKSGATRPAVGTLLPSYLPTPKEDDKRKKRPTPKHLLKYWDLQRGAFRQFIKANIH